MPRRMFYIVAMCFVLVPGHIYADIQSPTPREDVMAPSYQGVLAQQLPDRDGLGATLYRRYCDQCHKMVAPNHYRPPEWSAIMLRMRNNIKSLGKTLPTDEEWIELQRYLANNAQH